MYNRDLSNVTAGQCMELMEINKILKNSIDKNKSFLYDSVRSSKILKFPVSTKKIENIHLSLYYIIVGVTIGSIFSIFIYLFCVESTKRIFQNDYLFPSKKKHPIGF